MDTTRLMALIGLTIFAQSALANTIWLKDRNGNVCYNTGSNNPSHIIGYGGVNANGTGFTMTIDNPLATKPTSGDCANIPTTTTPLVLSGGNVVGNVVPVSNVKPGTKGVNECLNQGNNLVGITGGTSTGSGASTRTIAFSFNGAAGCLPNTYQEPYQRTVSIATGTGPFATTVYSGNYYVFNPTAVVPEPGSIMLLLAGGLGFGFVLRRRRS